MKKPETNRQGRPQGSRQRYSRTSLDGMIKLPTGAELGRLLGCDQRTCQRWLSGATKIPAAELYRWSRKRGWSAETFVAVASEFARRRWEWEAGQ